MPSRESKCNHPDQSMLFAVDRLGRAAVLAAIGSMAEGFFSGTQDEPTLLDRYVIDDHVPKGPGLYVWEGEVESVPTGRSDPEYGEDTDDFWQGACRPATPEDFLRFQFPLPGHSHAGRVAITAREDIIDAGTF